MHTSVPNWLCWAQKVVLVNLMANGLEDYAKASSTRPRPRTRPTFQGQGQGQGLSVARPRPRPRPKILALRPRPRPRINITETSIHIQFSIRRHVKTLVSYSLARRQHSCINHRLLRHWQHTIK